MRLKLVFITIFLNSLFYNGVAQIVGQKPLLKEDTARVNALLKESEKYLNEDPVKALALDNQARTMAVKINFPAGEAVALMSIGNACYLQGKFLEALDFYSQSLDIF